jgi:hypothetical protein
MDDLPIEMQQRMRRTWSEAAAKLDYAQQLIDDTRAYWATLSVEVRADPSIQALMQHLDDMEAAGQHAVETLAATNPVGQVG